MRKMSRGFQHLMMACVVFLVLAILFTVIGFTLSFRNRVMTLYATSVDKELYAYWQARFRYEYLMAYANDGAVDTDIFWNKIKDEKTGLTYGEDCQNVTDKLVERIVVAAYLYDASGHQLTDKQKEDIRLVTEERTKVGVFRGKDTYNEKAAYFGFDFNAYVEATMYEVKASLLGAMFVPTEEMQHQYYEDHYTRVKFVFVSADHVQAADTVALIRTALENGADSAQFDRWVSDTAYNDDAGSKEYIDGYYFSHDSGFAEEYFTHRPTVEEAIFSLDAAGDWCEVTLTKEGDKGTLFIYRYDLPETPAYSQQVNRDFFTDLTRDAGDVCFADMIKECAQDAVWYEKEKTRIPAAGYGTEVQLYYFFA